MMGGGFCLGAITCFNREYIHPNWPKAQISRWYCAPISGLSFNDNCIELRALPGSNGTVEIIEEPSTKYVTVHNTCRLTKKKKDAQFIINKKPGSNEIFVSGEVNSRKP